MIRFFQRKWNPSCYQGGTDKSHHFEGWYFKITDKNERHSFAIIPGVIIHPYEDTSHAFIQIFDGTNNKTFYHQFPIQHFIYKEGSFDIKINSNSFSKDRLVLELKSHAFEIYGKLKFTQLTPWPKTLISPGIMGWYTWVPFMECYHGIVSLNHNLEGTLELNGDQIDFSDGKGYTEKDWGHSFPEAYIWLQSNHFSTDNVTLTGSIAIIPWIKRPFLGLIFGLWHQDKLYRFTTYLGAKLIHFEMNECKVHCVLRQKKYILQITARHESGGYLRAPALDGMKYQISESLNSTLDIQLSCNNARKQIVIFNDTGRHAGFEMAGNIPRLLEMVQRTK
jgi:tocopherol cyclase